MVKFDDLPFVLRKNEVLRITGCVFMSIQSASKIEDTL